MLLWAHIIGCREVLWQLLIGLFTVRHGVAVDQLTIGQQLVGEHIHLLFGFAPFPDDITGIVVCKARFYAITGIIGNGQRDRAGGRNGGMVGKARTVLGNVLHQLGFYLRQALHIAAVFGV